MRALVTVASLGLFLSAAPSFAQAPAAPKPAPKPAAAPAQPAPQAAPAPQPPAPFPQGAKIGLVNLQQVASASADGKVATGKVNALVQKKQADLAAKQKLLQDSQAKLEQSGALMSESARTQLQKDIERQTVDVQRAQQDAQAEVTELQNELQGEFQKKLFPILQQLSAEKGLHVLLSAADAGVIWAEPGIDLTVEAIKRLDALAAPKPAAAPAAAPAAPKP